jgi:hypothetical protein
MEVLEDEIASRPSTFLRPYCRCRYTVKGVTSVA